MKFWSSALSFNMAIWSFSLLEKWKPKTKGEDFSAKNQWQNQITNVNYPFYVATCPEAVFLSTSNKCNYLYLVSKTLESLNYIYPCTKWIYQRSTINGFCWLAIHLVCTLWISSYWTFKERTSKSLVWFLASRGCYDAVSWTRPKQCSPMGLRWPMQHNISMLLRIMLLQLFFQQVKIQSCDYLHGSTLMQNWTFYTFSPKKCNWTCKCLI